MRRLKADLHTHTADDPCDHLHYSAEMLIDAAARVSIEVLAVSCHGRVAHTPRLARYAAARGIVLIPALEQFVDGKHVLIINPAPEHCHVQTFAQLRDVGRRDAAFVAPHPYYPTASSMGPLLEQHHDLFDAIEVCNLYYPFVDFNRRAYRAAQRLGLPLLGTSDTHALPYSDSTCAWLHAETSVAGIVEALRNGAIELQTQPRPWRHAWNMFAHMAEQTIRDYRAA